MTKLYLLPFLFYAFLCKGEGFRNNSASIRLNAFPVFKSEMEGRSSSDIGIGMETPGIGLDYELRLILDHEKTFKNLNARMSDQAIVRMMYNVRTYRIVADFSAMRTSRYEVHIGLGHFNSKYTFHDSTLSSKNLSSTDFILKGVELSTGIKAKLNQRSYIYLDIGLRRELDKADITPSHFNEEYKISDRLLMDDFSAGSFINTGFGLII